MTEESFRRQIAEVVKTIEAESGKPLDVQLGTLTVYSWIKKHRTDLHAWIEARNAKGGGGDPYQTLKAFMPGHLQNW